MASPQLELLQDLINTTQRELGRGKFEDCASDLTQYVVMNLIVKQNKVSYTSGNEIQWTLLGEDNGSAQNVAPYHTVTVANVDGTYIPKAPWRHSIASYVIDESEIDANSDPAKIVDLLKVKRAQAILSDIKLKEANFWGKPATSADDKTPWGIDYWLVRNASEGFYGGIPAGHTTIAGLPDYTWNRNWTGQYADVEKIDLIRKMRKAFTKTQWQSPIEGLNSWSSLGGYQIWTNYDVVSLMEELAEQQNDALGNDLASMDGRVLFRKIPITYVPKLDADTQNPVYGVNTSCLEMPCLKNKFMREKTFAPTPTQPTVVTTHVHSSYNYIIRNRRMCWVLYK